MTFELAPIDGLNEDQLTEMANLFAAKCQRSAQQTVKDAIVCGNALNELKSRTKHGEWRAWLRKNFDYSHETARAYQTLAANVNRLTFEPASIKAALRAIADDKAEEVEESDEQPVTPRAERVSGRVKVSQPEQPFGNPGQFDHSADVTKKVDENAVHPEPRTNTKHSKATAKAKEVDRPAPPVVTPVIVNEEPATKKTVHEMLAEESAEVRLKFAIREVSQVLTQIAVESERKSAAKQLRKLADALDPPSIGAPSIEDVEAWATEQGYQDFDSEKFFSHYSLAGWKYGKAKTPIKDWKIAARNAYSKGKGWAVDGANRLPF